MKVYLVEYRYCDDSSVLGIYTSRDVAEKHINQNIEMAFGKKALTDSKYRSRYSISIEDLIGE